MSPLDYEQSVRVANLVKAQPYRCWHNASKALIQLPGQFFLASYTEGWLVVPKTEEVQVIEHGWITRAGGQVVDPSIVLLEKQEQELIYFPGLHFSWSEVQALPERIPLPLAHLLSPTGHELGAPAYRAAYDAALAHAEELAHISGRTVRIYPKETILTLVTQKGTLIILF